MSQIPNEDDFYLASQVAQEDRKAFLALYDRHAKRVIALALRMLGEQKVAFLDIPLGTIKNRISAGIFQSSDQSEYVSFVIASPTSVESFIRLGVTIEPVGGRLGPTGPRIFGTEI